VGRSASPALHGVAEERLPALGYSLGVRRRGGAGPRLLLASLACVLWLAGGACSRQEPASAPPKPSILFVTLDTTRADAVAPEDPATTPNLGRLVSDGTRFAQAYATVPMTLPSHASLLTGLYPSEHGIHENSRPLGAGHALLAEQLAAAGYTSAAFISSVVLDRQFGLARGFDRYDDDLAHGTSERSATETTDRALAWLTTAPSRPLFVWVHYYDAHAPYAPPEPFKSRFAGEPYRGELAYVDEQLGRLLAAFRAHSAPGGRRIVVVGDHGESLGEHGEAQHGNLLYQGAVRVPLVLAGDGIRVATVDAAVSARRVHDTVLAWAGLPAPRSLLAPVAEPVLGEAMKPFLSYGWQPQVMAVGGRLKVIRSGGIEAYDLVADPRERHDIASTAVLDREVREALRSYPLPSSAPAGAPLPDETRQRLAALGYVASTGGARLRPDAPSARDMTRLFPDLDLGSGLFVRGDYAAAVPVFSRVVAADPGNPMAATYLAVAHSMLGHDEQALAWFRRAASVAPDSIDLRHYEAMHYCKNEQWDEAEPLLVSVLAAEPDRLPALSCLADVRRAQGRLGEAAGLLERVVAVESAAGADFVRLGEVRMEAGDTAPATAAFERARTLQGESFRHDLELGVLYLAARRLPEARDSLDRSLAVAPHDPMALFKRAQVSVLLGEADRGERVRQARAGADATTRPLVESEALFRGLL
jgi:arylsulfatase A-like enzyme/Tfp pilus assembly protein PilF